MHPIETAVEFLLKEHVRRGDAHSVAQAELHLVAIAEARPKEAEGQDEPAETGAADAPQPEQ